MVMMKKMRGRFAFCGKSDNFATPFSNHPLMDQMTTETDKAEMTGHYTVDDRPWYALRLFFNNQAKVADFFHQNGMESFIPMQYRVYEDEQGRPKRKLRPVVSNLIFIKKTVSSQEMQKLVKESDFKMAVITRDRNSKDYYEIPAGQMREFITMCNPEIEMRKYLSSEEARLKVGTPVTVCHGPLKGLSGKLVRQAHKYYLLKDVPGMSVMIKVSRWCCKVIES